MSTPGNVDFSRQRERMVAEQIAARGVTSPRVLEAMGRVRREGYVPSYLGEFAYSDAPLPIEEEQTISQPYIVAFMVDALHLRPNDRVLEVGTGSGYAAAVLAEMAAHVFTIERHEALARTAAERLFRDGYDHIEVRHGDGTLGWPEEAPFDAIIVAAGGPSVPESLREQLAIGGRLVIPVGDLSTSQRLERVTRVGEDEYRTETLADVRFVPLVGREGWHEERTPEPAVRRWSRLAQTVADGCEPFDSIDHVDLQPLLDRIGDARVVLLGEASHGTSEFYRMRTAITRSLIEQKGFRLVAVEADWPDAARVDQFVRNRDVPTADWQAFARFPTWMWRNQEVLDLTRWMRHDNLARPRGDRARFAGLDLYSMFTSIDEVLRFLGGRSPRDADRARERYGCLTPWQRDPSAYGRAALTSSYAGCEAEVVAVLRELLRSRLAAEIDEPFFDAVQNAALVKEAEAYYRTMYYGAAESWNLRDRHMFDTLVRLLHFMGPDSRAVIWAHNSHIGDARATEMSARGEWNIGELCRAEFGDRSYHVGFGTDHGTVAAASHWGGPMEIKSVRPALENSYERLCLDAGVHSFLLPLRARDNETVHRQLTPNRLERAIGVIYRPETERQSHYFHAELPRQFDEYVWFAETRAVSAIPIEPQDGVVDTFPSGL